jgi:ATP-dependent Zn protease
MELAALGSGTVLRDADVVDTRERSRQARFRRLLVAVAAVAALVFGRTAFGVWRYFEGKSFVAAGNASSAAASRYLAKAGESRAAATKFWAALAKPLGAAGPSWAAAVKHAMGLGTYGVAATKLQLAAGDYSTAAIKYLSAAGDFRWLPGVPTSLLPYLPALLLLVLLGAVMGGPLLGAGRSPHVLYRPEEIGISLADVVGAGAVVEEVTKTLNLFLAHRTFSERMGGTPRRAVLFEGPPGTGKTYIAKAMAAEAHVPFLFVSSSAFQSMYYGQTNRKIRSYFRALQKYARWEGGAIGFIEEIDAIGASRGGMGAGPGREGIAGVVNELLIQLQSFDVPPFSTRALNGFIDRVNRWLPPARAIKKRVLTPANFLVIGATNRASDLDPALLRPGRFDRTIRIDVPSRAGRRDIIDYYLARKAHEAELDDAARRDALAGSTFGYSPVMLEHLFDEALVWALRGGRSGMSWADVQQARMTAELGMTQAVTYSDGERLAIATHEAGHATAAFFAAPNRHLDVLSIIKRNDALGLLSHSDAEERFTMTRSECEALLRIAMGGMVAEELYFGEAGTGPAGDLSGATRLAAHMVGAYGMAGSLVSLEASRFAGDLVAKVLSDEAARHAVEDLLVAARDATRGVLAANLGVLEALRDALLERDELIGDEILSVIAGARGVGAEPVPSVDMAAVPGHVEGPRGQGAGPGEDVIDVRPSPVTLE